MHKHRITNDLLVERKGVHVKLNRDTHVLLRTKLFKHNMTMQELFEKFAQMLVCGDERCVSLLDEIVMKNAQAYAAGELKETSPFNPMRRIDGELSSDVLYDMICDDEDTHEQDC